MRGLLVEWLTAEGYSVGAKANGSGEARTNADLFIVDVCMPRVDGTSPLRGIRAAYPDTPVIAISARFRTGLIGPCSAADELGAHQVIAKPFSRSDLISAVRSLIGHPA